MWIDKVVTKDGRPYMAIAEAIRDAINSGELRPNDRLPPHRNLAWRLGIATATVSRGYALAMSWGLLVARVGSGTRVAGPSDAGPITLAAPDRAIDLGLLKPAPINNKALRRKAYQKSLTDIGVEWAEASQSYAPELGFPTHRQAGADWISRRGLTADFETTVVCQGAQEAFLLVLTLLTQPGETVMLEGQAYLGLKNLCELLKRRPIALALDEEGVLPESLSEAVHKSDAKVLFVTPFLQNPTGAVMSVERKKSIARIARAHDLFILEDDPFSELEEDLRPKLSSFAPERSFYVKSLSKYANPVVRIAFLVAPAEFMPEIEGIKHSLMVGGSSLQAALATDWLTSGLFDRICAAQRREIRARRQLFDRAFQGAAGTKAPVSAPFLWLTLPAPIRATDLAARAARAGVQVIAAERFTVGRASAPHCIRVAMTTTKNRNALAVAAGKLGDVIRDMT